MDRKPGIAPAAGTATPPSASHSTKTDVPITEELELRILETRRELRAMKEKLAPKFTLQDAFECNPSDIVGEAIKGLLSVGFLLESLSVIGNEEIDGRIAQGLGLAVQHYAYYTKDFLKARDALAEKSFFEIALEAARTSREDNTK